jgi:hypothetical protein
MASKLAERGGDPRAHHRLVAKKAVHGAGLCPGFAVFTGFGRAAGAALVVYVAALTGAG